jgi:hypothetical protein
MSWRRRLRIGLVPFIGEGRPTCSSSSPTRCAASPSSSASRGKTWCCSRVWCRTIWRGRVQRTVPKPPNLYYIFQGPLTLTQRKYKKVFGPLLSRLLCDVTAYMVAGNVRRHRVAVSAVLLTAPSGIQNQNQLLARITLSLLNFHDSDTSLLMAVIRIAQPTHCSQLVTKTTRCTARHGWGSFDH